MQAITIGLDIAKSVFQVHGVDAGGQVVIRRQLKRRYLLAFFEKLAPCLVGIEACASSHHWARELQALGHTVRLMPPAYVIASDAQECLLVGAKRTSAAIGKTYPKRTSVRLFCCNAMHSSRSKIVLDFQTGGSRPGE